MSANVLTVMNAHTNTMGGGNAPRRFHTLDSTTQVQDGIWSRMRMRVVDLVTKDGLTLRATRGNQRGVNMFGLYHNSFAKDWRVCFVGRGPWTNTWPKASAATIRDIVQNGASRYATRTQRCVTTIHRKNA